jgi:hypothetical protein
VSALHDMQAKGMNPAEVAYGLAHQRGFRGGGGGSALDAIARGQAAAKTLSGAGGRGGGELTYESVAPLKGEAFDAAFKKLTAQERERERRS